MDINVQAFRIAQQATEETPVAVKQKRASASRGGIAGGRRRAEILPPERRKEIAIGANLSRWNRTQDATSPQ